MLTGDFSKRLAERLGTYFGADVICPRCGGYMKNMQIETLCNLVRPAIEMARQLANRYRCQQCGTICDISLKYEIINQDKLPG